MKLSELTALYNDLDWQYNNAMSGPYIDYRDKTDDGETVAGLKDGRMTGAWRPMVIAGSDNWQKSEIQRLWDISQDIYFMDFLIDGRLSEVSRFLLKKGYRARPVFTQIIDLNKDLAELRSELRKSYRSLVNKTDGIENINVHEYRVMHEIVKNKTRDEITWALQSKMRPLVLRKAGSAVMFYYNDHCAYYASAFGDDIHALVWRAIDTLKGMGVERLELGEQVYHVGQIMMDGKPATEKHVNIAKFKAGFSGFTKTRLILEKQNGR